MNALVSKLRRTAARVAESFTGRPAQDPGFDEWKAGFDAGRAISRVAAQSRAAAQDADLDCNHDVPPRDVAGSLKNWHDRHETPPREVIPPRDAAGRPIEAAAAVGAPGCDIRSGFMGETCEECGSDNFGGPGFCATPAERAARLGDGPVEVESENLTLSIEIDEESCARVRRICEEFQDRVEDVIDNAIDIATASRILRGAARPEVDEQSRPESIEVTTWQDCERVFHKPDLHAATSAEVEARITKAYREGQEDGRADVFKASALDRELIARLGLLAEVSGGFSRSLGVALQGIGGRGVACGFEWRDPLDRDLDRIHAAAVVLRQAGDLPAIDIERRARLVGEYRAELGLADPGAEGAL